MTEQKVYGLLAYLDKRLFEKKATLEEGCIRKAEYQAPGRYIFEGKAWKKIKLPLLAAEGETIFFKTSFNIREAGFSLRFNFNNAEGLLILNGKPYCGIDKYHSIIRLPAILNKCNITVEFYFPAFPCFDRTVPHIFSSIDIVKSNPEIEEYYYLLKTVFEGRSILEEGKGGKNIEDIILQSVDVFYPDNPASIKQATRILKSVFLLKSISAGFTLYFLGHSHIDTAWLWQIKETVRKCSRTFSTALRNIENHNNFIFGASQIQQYSYVKKYYPEIYGEIKKRIQQGRWEVLGAQWVEPDCNLISGESHIRQFLYGKRYVKKEFGADVRIAWLPDVFGFPASLPQIFKGCGIDYFYTNKLYWGKAVTNRFPHSLFRWQGIDGSIILAHTPKLYGYYNGFPNPFQILEAEKEFKQKKAFPCCLFPFGYGDGGGGPSDEMLNYTKLLKKFPGLPETKNSKAIDYFDKAAKESKNLPVWKGELYYENHQGCYTSQSKVKKNNRKAENLLFVLEFLQSANSIYGKRSQSFRDIWQKVLTLQFHDILPGSSISGVYKDAEAFYTDVFGTINRKVRDNLDVLSCKKMLHRRKKNNNCIIFLNPLNWDRKEIVAGIKKTEVIEIDIPACGYTVYNPADCKKNRGENEISIKNDRMENRFFSVTFNKNGRIKNIYDKIAGRELIDKQKDANDFIIFKDGPLSEEAWNIYPGYRKTARTFGKLAGRKITERGYYRAILQQTFKEGKSCIMQEIIIYRDIPRIDFKTYIDWQERMKMLKVSFPTTICSKQAFYEIPFGTVSRPTTSNTSWEEAKDEVSAHKWACLSDGRCGIALLNDCKYGYDIKGSDIRMTLLRSSTYPDAFADKGKHCFTYSVFTFRGKVKNSEIVRQGYQLNIPLLSAPCSEPAGIEKSVSFIKTEGLSVIISAFKPSEDGSGYILRFYEPIGRKGKVKIKLPFKPKEVWETNLIEEKIKKLKVSENIKLLFGPFQIKTLLFM